jgi:hypothetical protein
MSNSDCGKIDYEYAVLWCVIIFFVILAGWANTSRCYWKDTYVKQLIHTNTWYEEADSYRTKLEKANIETTKALCEVEKMKMRLELAGKEDDTKSKAIKALLGVKDDD